MAAITWDDVVAVASELEETPEDAQDMFLAHVNTALAVGAFGGESSPKLKLVRVLLAAHMATLLSAGGENAAGPITSETASMNSISRSYAAISGGSEWDLTPYGRQYARLIRTSRGRFPRVS